MAKSPKTFEGVCSAIRAMLPEDVDGSTSVDVYCMDHRDGHWSGRTMRWSAVIKFKIHDDRLGEVEISASTTGAATPAKLLRELKRELNSAVRRALTQIKLAAPPPNAKLSAPVQQTLLLGHEK